MAGKPFSLTFVPRPVVRLGLQHSAEQKEMLENSVVTFHHNTNGHLRLGGARVFPPPVCEVVVGVGHVDEALDEVGALDEAEEHLKKTQKHQITVQMENLGGEGGRKRGGG